MALYFVTIYFIEQKITKHITTEVETDIHAVAAGRVYARKFSKEKIIVRSRLAKSIDLRVSPIKFHAPAPKSMPPLPF